MESLSWPPEEAAPLDEEPDSDIPGDDRPLRPIAMELGGFAIIGVGGSSFGSW